MANVLSNIVEAVTSADSLRVRTQQLRGSLLETICDFTGNNPRPGQNEAILLCPIKLHDRISSMRMTATTQGTVSANYDLALYGVDSMSGPTLITKITAVRIAQLAAGGAASLEAEAFKFKTLWQLMTNGEKDAFKGSRFKDDSSFILGLVKASAGGTVETAAGLTITLRTVEGAPSTQDASTTV